MVDSYEVLGTRIKKLTWNLPVREGECPPVMESFARAGFRRVTKVVRDKGVNLDIGEGGRSKKRFANQPTLIDTAESISWVTDRSVQPPVTRWLLNSIAGSGGFAGEFSGEGPAEVMYDVASERGAEIVRDMHLLLDLIEPKNVESFHSSVVLETALAPTAI